MEADLGSRGSIITELGLTEGEVLTHLEESGPTGLRRLTLLLARPPHYVVMAVGSLIRQGLIKDFRGDWDLVVAVNYPMSYSPDSLTGRIQNLKGDTAHVRTTTHGNDDYAGKDIRAPAACEADRNGPSPRE
ncbi:MAG: hypothetical protein HYT88_03530 [Candidatus Omnitrophica bacterium]|nr:hypothetical protein [Candidatus Omnitrophota bacterium]